MDGDFVDLLSYRVLGVVICLGRDERRDTV